MRTLICTLFCVAFVVDGGHSVQQTSWQRALFRNVSEAATKLSQLARPELLGRLSSMPFRAKLAECCPSVSKLSAYKLLQRLEDEVKVAEVVSGFDAVPPQGDIQPDSPGMSLDDGLIGSFFQNVWQDVLLHNETFTENFQQIWRANCSFDGQTVRWEAWPHEGCHGKPLYTVTYPLQVCFQDPSQGGILRYTCRSGVKVMMESWSSQMNSWKSRSLRRKLQISKPIEASTLIACPKQQPDWKMDYAADGACHSKVLWNASSMWQTEDDAEMYSYGLKPFKVYGAPASLAEASERGPYALVNNLLFDQGSPLFGDVSVVFSARTMRETALISAIDTGTYQIACVESQAKELFGLKLNCSAYTPYRRLGTLQDFNHLFLINDEFWNGTEAMLSYFARLEGAWGSWSLPSRRLLGYFEAVPVGALQYPSDVRFVIGSFRALFGSEVGANLQKWAKQRGWVLVWSLGLNVEKSDINSIQWVLSSNQSYRSNQRLVDPGVLSHSSAGKDLPVSESMLDKFNRNWEQVKAWRQSSHSINASAWALQWQELANTLTQDLQITPLRAGLCSRQASEPECIGISKAGHCLCYSHASSSITPGLFV